MMITDDWLLITDCLHTDDTEGDWCPQVDGGQVLITDIRLMITDYVHTENTDDTEARRRTTWLLINDYWLMVNDVHTDNTDVRRRTEMWSAIAMNNQQFP